MALNSTGDWRPHFRETVEPNAVDIAFRVAFDNLYTLRDQANANNSTLTAVSGKLDSFISGLGLNVITQVVQYKDWAGNNQTITVVTGVTLRKG